MLFDYDLIVPAGTLQTAPIVQTVKLTRGTITQIRVKFPPGPATLVHVQVLHNLFQLMPANPDGDLNFDDELITSEMGYDLTDAPYELIVRGWSPTAVYDHLITFQFEIEPVQAESWTTFVNQLKGLLNA